MKSPVKKSALSVVTTNLEKDRFAKIAAAYTRGAVAVKYMKDSIYTDNESLIVLPAGVEDCDEAVIDVAWGYLNHEMGHIEVQRTLSAHKKSKVVKQRAAIASPAILNLIPEELRFLGVESGELILTPIDILQSLTSKNKVSTALFESFGVKQKVVSRQLKMILNCIEDPRMEAQVSKRWVGARNHIEISNEKAFETWTARATAMIEEGTDGSFYQFTCGVIFYIMGRDVAFMGERTEAMVLCVKDILDVYRTQWNTEDSHGFFDAWNASLALLIRVYQTMGGAFEPEPEEQPEEQDEDESGGEGEGNDESEEGEEGEEGESSDDGGPSDSWNEDSNDDESSNEGGEGGDESPEDAESDADASDGESGDDESSEGDEGDSGESAESDSETGDDDGAESDKGFGNGEGDSDEDSKSVLKVGMRIKLKSNGKTATITKIYKDGSIEAS